MKKIRVVIDTNVFLVSLAPNFRLHWIYQFIIEGKYELCVSTEILNEYQEIISQRYGVRKTDSVLDFLLLLPNIRLITPHFKWNLLDDPDDNKFVDCAIAGNADYIISNDKDFKKLVSLEFPPIQLLNSQEFEDRYKDLLKSI